MRASTPGFFESECEGARFEFRKTANRLNQKRSRGSSEASNVRNPSAGIIELTVVAPERRSRQPIWPAFVIALGLVLTLLWSGALVWLIYLLLSALF